MKWNEADKTKTEVMRNQWNKTKNEQIRLRMSKTEKIRKMSKYEGETERLRMILRLIRL